MSDPTSNFDEPDLKRAIRAVAEPHRASAALRDRVAQAMASVVVPAGIESKPGAPSADRPPMRIGPSPLKRYLTLAAAVVIGFAVCYQAIQYYDNWKSSHSTSSTGTGSGGYAISETLLDDMIALHTRGAKLDTSPADPRDLRALQASPADAAALAHEATDALKRSVPKPVLAGWTIDRAALSDVSGYQAARFHFTKGAQSVTLISLPANAWAYPSSDHYCASVHNGQQAIAGYLTADSLNCLVGDPSMSTADVDGLLTSLRNQ